VSAPERKKLLLRLDPVVHDALARWAGDELRSTNAQIEFLLRRALGEAGRMPGGVGRMRRPGRPARGPRSSPDPPGSPDPADLDQRSNDEPPGNVTTTAPSTSPSTEEPR
jgi:hypothetical protein